LVGALVVFGERLNFYQWIWYANGFGMVKSVI
jgi:hypothetical protein